MQEKELTVTRYGRRREAKAISSPNEVFTRRHRRGHDDDSFESIVLHVFMMFCCFTLLSAFTLGVQLISDFSHGERCCSKDATVGFYFTIPLLLATLYLGAVLYSSMRNFRERSPLLTCFLYASTLPIFLFTVARLFFLPWIYIPHKLLSCIGLHSDLDDINREAWEIITFKPLRDHLSDLLPKYYAFQETLTLGNTTVNDGELGNIDNEAQDIETGPREAATLSYRPR